MSQLVSLSDDVYKTLTYMKGKSSYSEVIRKLIEKRSNKDNILECFGKGGIDGKKVKELEHLWKKWSEKYA